MSGQRAPAAVILIRLMTGAVFFSEGIQKFLFPQELGIGRFTRIGMPAPEVLAPFVGGVEIVCGALLIVGLFTRLAAIPLIINMFVAIATTKLPILVREGFWSMAHESRTDFSMLLGSLFLLFIGPARGVSGGRSHSLGPVASAAPDRRRFWGRAKVERFNTAFPHETTKPAHRGTAFLRKFSVCADS